MLAAAVLLLAQTPPGFRDALAFVDVKLENGDGVVAERTTVLVRDGLVEAVAPDAKVPAWYRRIEGKGLTLTPAFLDAYYALPAPPAADPELDGGRDQAEDAPYAMRAANRRGVRPELDAALLPAPPAELMLAERRAGFGLVNLVPAGLLVGGSAALAEATSAPRRDAVLARDTGRAAGFRYVAPTGAPRAYPGSLMGNIAQLRQFALDAAAPAAPGDDAGLRAYRDSRFNTFLWQADTSVDLRRAARLAAEFGKRVIPVGGGELDEAADAVPGPIIFSPNPARLPLPPAGTRAVKERDGRRDARRKALADGLKGREFALTRAGYTDRADFWKDLKSLIDAGLPRTAALKALTGGAARVIGVDGRFGLVAPGRAAYLALWDGDPLSGKAVRHLVLKGVLSTPGDERPAVASPRIPSERDLCGCGGDPAHDHSAHPDGGH